MFVHGVTLSRNYDKVYCCEH